MRKILCVFLLTITSLCCFASCEQASTNQKETLPIEDSISDSISDVVPTNVTEVTFDSLIRTPEKYKDKLIQIRCYVSSTKDYLSFQSVRVSTKKNMSGDYEQDGLALKEDSFYTWNVLPVDTWQYTQYDTRLRVGDCITIEGYFRFRQDGESAEWYDGIVSAGDYGKIFATDIIINNAEE